MTVKCDACGRFMSYEEMDNALADFTPLHDGPMGDVPESIEFTHRGCALAVTETRQGGDAKQGSGEAEGANSSKGSSDEN